MLFFFFFLKWNVALSARIGTPPWLHSAPTTPSSGYQGNSRAGSRLARSIHVWNAVYLKKNPLQMIILIKNKLRSLEKEWRCSALRGQEEWEGGRTSLTGTMWKWTNTERTIWVNTHTLYLYSTMIIFSVCFRCVHLFSSPFKWIHLTLTRLCLYRANLFTCSSLSLSYLILPVFFEVFSQSMRCYLHRKCVFAQSFYFCCCWNPAAAPVTESSAGYVLRVTPAPGLRNVSAIGRSRACIRGYLSSALRPYLPARARRILHPDWSEGVG